ncbi:ATP-dependent helicase [Sedimentibacter sp. zth1]|uniref:UvrD-helicase domain-containing protein n=1 Tax=Sedimentibacter sp. zth1 TaxID=2816908 RepID=UPI001A920E4B|nr:UvrD-helicase domain-containing protein [Sedimentibacter sp. zth1]QSX04788.1 ATP-dependent helicase [Sedimentibacter sp. zth1]
MNYNNLSISQDKKEKEDNIVIDIFDCVDKRQSIVFDAGAGAGKTYTLIKTLKYIIEKNNKELEAHNQKILCITYTNVATNEIKGRLGNTSLVDVSTIHVIVWDIIKPYQKQLVQIHKEKLNQEINFKKNALQTEKWAEKYKKLNEEKRLKFLDVMVDKKDLYYKCKNELADVIEENFKSIMQEFDGILDNKKHFKKVVDCLFRIKRYKETVTKIDDKKLNEIKYDARYNFDRLDKMCISHDTLLEYTYNLVNQNNLLKHIICDKYPFILVDEYQDTDYKVVTTLSLLDDFSKTINHRVFIGYYGDLKQNIYNTGVGDKFTVINKNLCEIQKKYNRRSMNEIIEVANKVRNDGLIQESIYDNFTGGSVNFYANTNITVEEFINKHIEKWNITQENQLHCFVLTNKVVAKESGFENIYNFFELSNYYRTGINYKNLSQELLSTDTKKLGVVQNLIFKIIDFRNKINDDRTMVYEIIYLDVCKVLNIELLRELINKFKKISGESLKEYIYNIFKLYNQGDKNYDICIDYYIGKENNSYKKIEETIFTKLFQTDEDNDDGVKKDRKKVEEFLNLNIDEFDLWYNYIISKRKDKVIYHTYHGTKGLEFDNVIIIMKNQFNRDNEYFSKLFKSYFEVSESGEGSKIEKARNLLYVATTRAVKNLSILYLDEISNIKDEIEHIFGQVQTEV